MSLPLIPLLQTQLETTLRLLISVSQDMTPDEIMAVRIRLNEAALVMGDIVANQSNCTTNGNPTSIPALQPHRLTPVLLTTGESDRLPAGCTTAPRNTGTPNSGGSRRSSTRPSTSQGAADRPAARRLTRSTARVNPSRDSLLPGNRQITLIEMCTDSDED
jgi:hypothetical protein